MYKKVPEGTIGINMPANFVQDYGNCLSAKMTRWSKRQFTPPMCLPSVLCGLVPVPFLPISELWRDFGSHSMVTATDTMTPLCLCLLPDYQELPEDRNDTVSNCAFPYRAGRSRSQRTNTHLCQVYSKHLCSPAYTLFFPVTSRTRT